MRACSWESDSDSPLHVHADVAIDVLAAEAQRAPHVHGRKLPADSNVPQGGTADVEQAHDIRHLEQAIVWNGSECGHVFLLDQARGWDCIEQMFCCQGERMFAVGHSWSALLEPVLEPGMVENAPSGESRCRS